MSPTLVNSNQGKAELSAMSLFHNSKKKPSQSTSPRHDMELVPEVTSVPRCGKVSPECCEEFVLEL